MEKIAKEHIHDLSEELAKELIALGSAELTLTDVGPPTQEMFFHCALSPCLFLSYTSNASPHLTLLLFLPPHPFSPLSTASKITYVHHRKFTQTGRQLLQPC